MCDLRAGTLVGQAGTRVPFSDLPLRFTFPIEQFWGRAARASWVRKNPDARLIFPQVCMSRHSLRLAQGGSVRYQDQVQSQRQVEPPRTRVSAPHVQNQFVEMVKFTVMRACVSTGCPFCM
jgi:hypothetical protein